MQNISFNKSWITSVSFTEFKKNPIVKQLETKQQIALYEKHSGKKVRQKS